MKRLVWCLWLTLMTHVMGEVTIMGTTVKPNFVREEGSFGKLQEGEGVGHESQGIDHSRRLIRPLSYHGDVQPFHVYFVISSWTSV